MVLFFYMVEKNENEQHKIYSRCLWSQTIFLGISTFVWWKPLKLCVWSNNTFIYTNREKSKQNVPASLTDKIYFSIQYIILFSVVFLYWKFKWKSTARGSLSIFFLIQLKKCSKVYQPEKKSIYKNRINYLFKNINFR